MLSRAIIRKVHHGIKDLEERYNPFSSNLDRIGTIARSAYLSITDPNNGDHISRMGEATSFYTLQEMRRRMLADPVGRQILKEKPRIRSDEIPIEWLKSLPDNTFGRSYISYMGRNDFKADERPIPEKIGDIELAYVFERYKEIHDVLHSIMNLSSSVYDELLLKWYEFHQTGLLSSGLASMIGPALLSWQDRQKLFFKDGPAILEKSRRSRFFMNVYFEKHFEQDYSEFLKYFFQEESSQKY